jgi:tRNA/rRNA methyltransferase
LYSFVSPFDAFVQFSISPLGSIVIPMEFRFILVEPSVPENVGSVARALKTFGFHSLSIVNSEVHKEEKAQWVAHGSREILQQAMVYATVKEAVEGLDFVVATTARRRTLHHDYHTPRELRRLIGEKEGTIHRVGLLFGREESGLTNEELAVAHCLSTIPLVGAYPSLNLAQAVLVYAYELSPIQVTVSKAGETGTGGGQPGGSLPTYQVLHKRVRRIFERIGLGGENLVGRRLLERLALLSSSDLRLVHSLCTRVEKSLALEEEGRE